MQGHRVPIGLLALALLLLLHLHVATVHADVLVYDKGETLVDEFNDLPARFGPSLPLEGLYVYPVMASDVYGCGELKPPPAPAHDVGAKFVVLMARNNCSFFEKVQNAERAGYQAAIVYNVGSDDLVEMSGDSGQEDVRIPAIFVGNSTALEIELDYSYDPKMYDFVLLLNRNLPFNVNTRLLWVFVAVVAFVFLSMVVATIVKCIRHRNRQQRQRLPNNELQRLPVIKFNPTGSRYFTCSICLDDYVEGERLRLLPCQHTYHTKCVDPWLTHGKRNCPLCKRKIRRRHRRQRRRTSDSDTSTSSSGSNQSVPNAAVAAAGPVSDTTPLLEGGNSSNGTFPESVNTQASRGFVRRFLGSLFSARTAEVNERENPNPRTVSAVVDMSPAAENRREAAAENAVPVFQAPSLMPHAASFSGHHSAMDGVLVTTPISSPLHRAAQAHSRSRSSEAARTSDGTPRIGVAALPNVGFQGMGSGGGGAVRGIVLPQPPSHVEPPAEPSAAENSSRSSSRGRRHRRPRRGGGGGGGADGGDIV